MGTTNNPNPMKKLLILLTALGIGSTSAAEFMTLFRPQDMPSTTVTAIENIDPASVITIPGFILPTGASLRVTFSGSSSTFPNIIHGNSATNNATVIQPGMTLTGVTKIELKGTNTFVTFRFSTPGDELIGDPVTLPTTTEAYDVILETSTDLQNWVPTVPGEFIVPSGMRFFRVKMERK